MAISVRRVAANALWLFAGTALTRVLSALALIIIARQLGVESYGQFVASQSLTGLTTVMFTLGMEGLLLREGGKDHARLPKLITSGVMIVLALGVIWIIGITWVAARLDVTVFAPNLVFLAALAFWFDGLSMIAWAGFKAALKNRRVLALMAGSQMVWLVLVGVCAALRVRDPQVYLIASAVASLMAAIASLWSAGHMFGWQFDRSMVWPTAIASLPFALSIAFALIYGKADVSIVANYLGKTAAGLYGPAIAMVSAFVLAPAAVYGVLVPALSRVHIERPHAIGALFPKVTVGMILIGVALGGALAVCARPLVRTLYGAEFAAAGDVLAVLSGVLSLRCVSIGLASILVAIGWQKHRAVMQGVSAGLNVVLNLIFVMRWGILGAAAIYVISELALAIGYAGLIVIWRNHDRPVVGAHIPVETRSVAQK